MEKAGAPSFEVQRSRKLSHENLALVFPFLFSYKEGLSRAGPLVSAAMGAGGVLQCPGGCLPDTNHNHKIFANSSLPSLLHHQLNVSLQFCVLVSQRWQHL